MLNMFVMQGTIVGLNTFPSQKGKTILEFGLKANDGFGNEIVVTMKSFGTAAQAISEGIKKGSSVTVQGDVGVYNDQIQLVAKEVHIKGQVLSFRSVKGQLKDQAPTSQEGQQGEKKEEKASTPPESGMKL